MRTTSSSIEKPPSCSSAEIAERRGDLGLSEGGQGKPFLLSHAVTVEIL